MKLALPFLIALLVSSVAAAKAPATPVAGSSCVKTADCGSPSLFCEYTAAGCHGTVGTCRSTSCVNDPMSFTYCGCDGKTAYTGSMCKPDRPFASLAACP